MYSNGWIKLHREIQSHWVFQRDDYFKAWILLLLKANHQDYKTLVSDKIPEVVLIKRGEVVSSLKKLGLELKWSPSKVKRFLQKLKKDEMIVVAEEKRWTHLTILNYETYQYSRHDNESDTNRTRHDNEHNIIKNKNDNKKKKLSKNEQLQGIKGNILGLQKKFPLTDVKLEFERMSDWLLSSGKQYKNYGAFFNNWLRKANEERQLKGKDEEIITYYYKCEVCKKLKDKSTYRDLFLTCCNTELKPMKE